MANQFKPVTLDDMHLIASNRHGKCLSDKYINSQTKLLWKCKEGHSWEAIPNNIKKGRWCPYCSTRPPKTIEDARQMAKDNGGFCLSSVYKNVYSPLKWKCKEGHIWLSTFHNIHSRHWCPKCSAKRGGLIQRKWNIDKLNELAKLKGGRCSSDNYLGYTNKLKWVCSKNHTWLAAPVNIINGTWCPKCSLINQGLKRRVYDIEDMQEFAFNNEGQCLSIEYKGVKSKLKWKCKNNHIWRTTPDAVIQGKWCPYCGHSMKLKLNDIKKTAIKRGGACLSDIYLHSDAYLDWICRKGHKWKATAHSVLFSGSWCPHCSSGLGERICREVLQILLEFDFPKSRPNWLLNDNGYKLELDGYSSELGLAFEYHGRQHFEIGNFSNGIEELENRKKVDQLKRKLCSINNIILIEIPYTIKYSDIPTYLFKICSDMGYKINKNFESISILDLNIYDDKDIELMHKIARKRGGKCLSEFYVNASTNLIWQCHEGHIWQSTPNTIKSKKSWCKICALNAAYIRRRSQTLAKIKSFVKDKYNGDCLSKEYTSGKSLTWKCNKNHVWNATFNNLRHGYWCPTCRLLKN